MSAHIITRLRPADLREVQVQTATNATLSDIILSLKAGKSTELVPLNTFCPTCNSKGTSLGYLTFSYNGVDHHSLCPTCKGFALIHTADGGETPPVNPFDAPLVVTRLLPSDLIEALIAYPASSTLDLMIISLQAGLPDINYDCSVCSATGWVTIGDNKNICYICNGYQKTIYQIPAVAVTPIVDNMPTFNWPPVVS